jgi:hypothetical protein
MFASSFQLMIHHHHHHLILVEIDKMVLFVLILQVEIKDHYLMNHLHQIL